MDILKCKSYTEIGKLLGYKYYNGRVKKIIIEYCREKGLDVEEIIRNNKKPNKCLFCGREVEGKRKYLKKFCNSSCAASYNNKNKICSEEQKRKVSLSLNNHYSNDKSGRNFKKISKLIEEGEILNPFNAKYRDGYVNGDKYKERICEWCGKAYKPFLRKSGKITLARYCSKECGYNAMCEKNVQKALERIEQGKHQGWKTRNIVSYPEKFWMGVLDNNLIPYIKEKYVFNKYFLDFFIEKNGVKIDLEIDGKQHLYEDRKLHDKIRDKLLTENGYVVYRIAWNEINSDEGKQTMKNKINDFLSFYNNI